MFVAALSQYFTVPLLLTFHVKLYLLDTRLFDLSVFKSQVNFDSCSTRATNYSCTVFNDRHPSTVSMTVLVVVEMFNALNNLSENQSLL